MTVIDQFDLSGRVAIVTGGTRGIGRAISVGLAQAGADVVPTSRTAADVDAATERVREQGSDSITVPTDVTDQDDVDRLIDETVTELGGVDVVVNNAGINPDDALGLPEAVSEDGFDRTVDVNLRGAFRCTRVVAPYLKKSDTSSIVNVASVGGVVGLPRQHPYVASKHGLIGMTKSMALDWASDIRVNAIAPGYVATDMTEGLRDDTNLRASIVDRTPLERFADPKEIAGAAVFLASDVASFVTGECLAVGGGWTAR